MSLTKGAILVKRLPLANARFEVVSASGTRIALRRLDGDRKNRAEPIEIEAAHLARYGYLLERDAAPHPLELEKKQPAQQEDWS